MKYEGIMLHELHEVKWVKHRKTNTVRSFLYVVYKKVKLIESELAQG